MKIYHKHVDQIQKTVISNPKISKAGNDITIGEFARDYECKIPTIKVFYKDGLESCTLSIHYSGKPFKNIEDLPLWTCANKLNDTKPVVLLWDSNSIADCLTSNNKQKILFKISSKIPIDADSISIIIENYQELTK